LESPIIATKYIIPKIRSNLVARPHLFKRLDFGAKSKLTLISAPAGFGKTTLLSKWMNKIDRAPAWVSLDKNDDSLARFITNLIFGIRRINPEFGDQILMMLQVPQPPESEMLLSVTLNEIMDSMEPFVLVLDDYHFIEAEKIHQAVGTLLDNLPSNMRVIISGRSDPPLPLGRLRANGDLLEIRADELRFSIEETILFFNEIMSLKLSNSAIKLLEERTEGWIAGLHLAGLYLSEKENYGEFVNEFSGSHRYVIDYLVEEVLNQQTEIMSDFLLQTSILDKFNASLCERITEISDSQAILDHLEEKNLFIVPLDDQRRWYRYHHLFADLLRKRINHLDPDKRADLNLRASTWYEEHAMTDDAIQHALDGKDINRAARLVEDHSKDWIGLSQFEKLTHWLSALPDEIKQTRPYLGMVIGWSNALFNRFDIAEPAFQRAEESYQSAISKPELLSEFNLVTPKKQALFLGQIATGRASIARAAGDLPRSIELLNKSLDLIPESEKNERSVAFLFLGYAYWMTGKIPDALDMFEQAKRNGLEGENLLTVQSAIDASGKLLFENGDLHQGMRLHQQAISLAKSYAEKIGFESSNVGLAHNGMAKIYYEWNELDQALDHANCGVQVFEPWGVTENLLDSYSILWRIKFSLGENQNSLLIAEKAATLVNQPGVADWLRSRTITDQAILWTFLGKENSEHLLSASRWVKNTQLSYDDEITYFQEIDYTNLARFFLYQNRTREALIILRKLVKNLETSNRTGRLIEVFILQSLALEADKNTNEAVESLVSALTLAEQENLIRTFINEGEDLLKVLVVTVKDRSEPLFAKKVIKAFKTVIQQPSGLIENLSERELEVLKLISQGFTAPEIAENLFLSLNTIKTHIKNIYSKLGVNKRSSALISARELNLIR